MNMVFQEESEISAKALLFVTSLRSFYEVVKACFGQEVQSNFRDEVEKFRHDYLLLNISVTPKVKQVKCSVT